MLAVPIVAQEPRKDAQAGPDHIYRLDYVIAELEGGKRAEARDYSMVVENGRPGRIRIGTRVPIATGTSKEGVTQWQYMDVGVNIDAQAWNRTDTAVRLQTKIETTSVVAHAGGSQPTTRQFRTENDTMVPFGKSTTLFTVDEPNSKRSFQVQVTVTRVPQP